MKAKMKYATLILGLMAPAIGWAGGGAMDQAQSAAGESMESGAGRWSDGNAAGRDSSTVIVANGGRPAKGPPLLGLSAPAPKEHKRSALGKSAGAFKKGFLWTEFPLKAAAGDDLSGTILVSFRSVGLTFAATT